MQVLSYGYKLPEDGDKGTIFWPALAFDISRLNDHTHDGANSSQLSAAAITKILQTVTSAGWVLQPNGLYRQTVTMPGALLYSSTVIQIRESVSEEPIYLSTEKVTANSFYVYANDNTLGLKIIYS